MLGAAWSGGQGHQFGNHYSAGELQARVEVEDLQEKVRCSSKLYYDLIFHMVFLIFMLTVHECRRHCRIYCRYCIRYGTIRLVQCNEQCFLEMYLDHYRTISLSLGGLKLQIKRWTKQSDGLFSPVQNFCFSWWVNLMLYSFNLVTCCSVFSL